MRAFDHPLQSYNTFRLPAQAEMFFALENPEDLHTLLALAQRASSLFILGNGSNLLLTQDVPGLVVHSALKGIEKLEENAESVTLKIASGEDWHALVMHTVAQNWWGIENLALIPSSVGAAAVQNIGAYGVELSHVLMEVEGVHLTSGQRKTLTQQACQFGYRDSVFKQPAYRDFLILSLTLRVSKRPNPQLNYADLPQLAQRPQLSAQDVAEWIMAKRRAKLPDPLQVPNAGSFFKNPMIPLAQAHALKAQYADMPQFRVTNAQGEDKVKLAAGWLIEQAGWKGFASPSGAGVYEKQALVLVNRGQATGADLLQLKDKIQASVQQKFGVLLEPEVIIV